MTTITIEIDDSGAIVLQGAEGAEYVQNGLEGDTEAPEGDVCPIATQNIAANLEARDNAIEVANYGPLDPGRENADYWGAAADRWSVSVEEVKTARCGNCAAFNVTSRIRACIADGVGGADAWEVVDAGELGYCEAFDFKCASARRCDAWVQGGPLTDELEQSMEPQPGDEEDLGQDEVEIKIVAPAWMAANARQGISWVNEGYGGDGLTPQTLREARLMAGGTVSEDKAARMAAWFARHMVDLNAPAAMVGAEGYPSNGVVAHALWGGGSMTDSKRAAAWARARTADTAKASRQPRVPAGSSSGGQFGDGGGGAAGRPQTSDSITSEETRIRSITTHEEARAVSGSGEVLFNQVGKAEKVEFTKEQVEVLKNDGNAVVTHNHPFVASISNGDIEFASNSNLAQIRAVDSKYTYTWTRPKKGWGADKEDDSHDQYLADKKKITGMKSLWQKTANREGRKLVDGGSRDKNFINETATHLASLSVSKKYGIQYERIPVVN